MPRFENLKSIATTQTSKALYGEIPLPFAPQICLSNGQCAVPQQYLKVERSVANLEEILEKINFAEDYLLFADQHNGVLSIQVGIIGCENYPYTDQQAQEKKIVYGRRWLIEPSAPTSEVIQTAMLAIKKAREHELREHVLFYVDEHIKTTPFNSHMDLPLMSKDAHFFKADNIDNQRSLKQRIETLLQSVEMRLSSIRLDKITVIDETRTLIDLQINSEVENTHFPEFNDQLVSILSNGFDAPEFLHELMNALVKCSDRYIEENFMFDGFARFSQEICPQRIAHFSHQTRKIQHKDPRFHRHFREMSYDVDASKAPNYASGKLGEQQRSIIKDNNVTGGHFPNEEHSRNVTEAQSS